MKIKFDLEVLKESHQYINTGGHCMVGVTQAYNKLDNRTYFIMVNEEGVGICTADTMSNDLEFTDNMQLEYIRWDDPSLEKDPQLAAYREAYLAYIIKEDSEYYLPWFLLSDELKATVTEHYKNWIETEENGMFETNGRVIYHHPGYEAPEVLSDPDIIACQSLLDYMNEAMAKGMNGPNSTPEEQEALDAAAEEFYSKKIILGFDNKVIVLGVGAAEFTGLQDCLQYIIEQR